MSGVICGAIVVDDSGRIALVKEAKQWARGKWMIPGGKLEQGESIEDATRREVKEEANLDVKLLGLIGIYRYTRDNWVQFAFLAKPIGGKLKHRKGELLDARWFTEKEFLELKDNELRLPLVRRMFKDWKGGRLYPLSMFKKF